MTKIIYVVTENNLMENLMSVELFKDEKDARQYIDTIISEYGIDYGIDSSIDSSQIIYDNDNWYDLDLEFFDIMLTKKQINF